MKKLLFFLFCVVSLLLSQTNDMIIGWDTDKNETVDVTKTVSLNDTITARIYLTQTRTVDSVTGISFFCAYGHQPNWMANTYSQNCLTYVDTNALRDTATAYRITTRGRIRMDINIPSKLFYFTWYDTNSVKYGVATDTCLIEVKFKATARGVETLKIFSPGVPSRNGWDDYCGTQIFSYAGAAWKPYSLTIKNCIITVQ